MGQHPVNLALRFVLEMVALVAYFLWGTHQVSGVGGYAVGAALVLVFGAIWGVFRVPGDASASGRAPVPVAGSVRLLLELLLFTGAVLALLDAGYDSAAFVFAAATLIHYIASYDRIAWLLSRNAPDREDNDL